MSEHNRSKNQSDEPRFCSVTSDGRHPAGVVLAAWEVPGIGDMCNYHAAEGWPDLFITKTVTSAAEADADLKGKSNQ